MFIQVLNDRVVFWVFKFGVIIQDVGGDFLGCLQNVFIFSQVGNVEVENVVLLCVFDIVWALEVEVCFCDIKVVVGVDYGLNVFFVFFVEFKI